MNEPVLYEREKIIRDRRLGILPHWRIWRRTREYFNCGGQVGRAVPDMSVCARSERHRRVIARSEIPRSAGKQSRISSCHRPGVEIASPVFQRGRNDILWPPVTEGLRLQNNRT